MYQCFSIRKNPTPSVVCRGNRTNNRETIARMGHLQIHEGKVPLTLTEHAQHAYIVLSNS